MVFARLECGSAVVIFWILEMVRRRFGAWGVAKSAVRLKAARRMR